MLEKWEGKKKTTQKADKQWFYERIVVILHFYNILHFAQDFWSKMESFLLIFLWTTKKNTCHIDPF